MATMKPQQLELILKQFETLKENSAFYAKKFEGMVPKKKVAIMEPNAPPAAAANGSGYRRRFYH